MQMTGLLNHVMTERIEPLMFDVHGHRVGELELLINPSMAEFTALLRKVCMRPRGRTIRFIYDPNRDRTYVWAGYEAVHAVVLRSLMREWGEEIVQPELGFLILQQDAGIEADEGSEYRHVGPFLIEGLKRFYWTPLGRALQRFQMPPDLQRLQKSTGYA